MFHHFFSVKVVNTSLSRKKSSAVLRFQCQKNRGVASLENCLERWLAAYEVQDWKYTSCSQRASGVKKLLPEAVPELLMIQLKIFRKVESSAEKVYTRVKFSMDKTVIGGKKV